MIAEPQTQQSRPDSRPYSHPFLHPAIAYLEGLFHDDDHIFFQAIHAETGRVRVLDLMSMSEAATPFTMSRLETLQSEGYNIYISMNPFPAGSTARKQAYVTTVRNVYIDADDCGLETIQMIAPDVALGIIPAPHSVLASCIAKNKYHIVWHTDGLTPDEAASLNRTLQVRYKGDKASTDIHRLLRMPGFRNLKYPDQPICAVVELNPGPAYTLSQFKIKMAPVTSAKRTPASSELLEKIITYIEGNAKEALFELGDCEPDGDGYRWLIECPWVEGHTTPGDSAIIMLLADGRPQFNCFHTHCSARGWSDIRKLWQNLVGHFQRFGDPVGVFGMSGASGKTPKSKPSINPEVAMTEEEIEQEMDKEYPCIPLTEQTGPSWDDGVMTGVLGQLVRKISLYNESHPSGMFLDLLVSLGSMMGRSAYFSINSTRHYTNQYLCRAGATSTTRKGTGRGVVDAINKLIDPVWCNSRTMSGFGSAESVVNEIRDSSTQQKMNRRDGTFKTIIVPGVGDKRLCLREGELASVFLLASKPDSRLSIVLRDGWDGVPLHNIVKGKSGEGLSNSTHCLEPHLSISGDTTISELHRTMPSGSDQNGFGNRFPYCFVTRTKLCPQGGPPVDWDVEIDYLRHAVEFAKQQKYVPMSDAARKVWNRLYRKLEDGPLTGMAGAMTARGPAHIRRFALIIALLDMSAVVEAEHLHAARQLWEYCQESAQYIFNGLTKDQVSIFDFVVRHGPTTVAHISEQVFHQNKKVGWLKAQIDGCEKLVRKDEDVSICGN